jgi:hypothetical protein
MQGAARLRASLSRRAFLRYTAVNAGLLALSRLRVVPVLAAPVPVGLQVLDAREAEILSAIVERMVDNGDPHMPAVRDTGAIVTIDQALLQVEAGVRWQLRWLLKIFEWGPPLFQLELRTFTGMTAAARDGYIRDWAQSSIGARRLAYSALKNLAMLGYYAQDATWKGIHYDGPWVPRPRRVVRA